MKIAKKICFVALAGWLLAGTAAGVSLPQNREITVLAAANSLNKTELTISKGESYTLLVRGDYKKVTWSVDKKSVATVTNEGVVKGVSGGKAVVSATVDGVKYECTVTVEQPKLNRTKLTARLGNTYQLSVSGTTRKISYRSSDSSVVKVSSKGKMTFLKPGSATVTATVGSSRLACQVQVNQPSITIPDLMLGQEAFIDLAGKTYKNISFVSSAPEVLSVDSAGRLFATQAGSAQITVKIADYEYTKKVKISNSLPAAAKYGSYEGLDAKEKQVAQKAHEILDSILSDEKTEIEKILALHDYIVLNTAYDTTYTRYSIKNTLIDGSAVCQGYAETMKLFLDAVGIENQLIYGTGSGISHVWNLIRLDGDWYHMDVTWDDPLLDGKDMPGTVHYEYFMVPDAVMAREHTWKAADYPVAEGGVYETYIQERLADLAKEEGLFAETPEEFANLVTKKAETGQLAFDMLYAGGSTDTDALLQKTLSALAKANPGKNIGITYGLAPVGEYMQFMLEIEIS